MKKNEKQITAIIILTRFASHLPIILMYKCTGCP